MKTGRVLVATAFVRPSLSNVPKVCQCMVPSAIPLIVSSVFAMTQLMGPFSQSKKVSMKNRFGKNYVKKDGTNGKAIVVPPVLELQTAAATRDKWIQYSALDAKVGPVCDGKINM